MRYPYVFTSFAKWFLVRLLRYRTGIGFCILVIFWGFFPITAKMGVQDAPPFFLSSLRLTIAAVIMIIITKCSKCAPTRLTPYHYQRVVFVGIFISGLPSGAFAAAACFMPAGTLAVLWAMMPIFTALFSVRDPGEVRGWRLLLSILSGSIGILVVLTGDIPHFSHSQTSAFLFTSTSPVLLSSLTLLTTMILAAFAMRVARQSLATVPIVVVTTWQVFSGCLFLAVMSFCFEHGQFQHFTWRTLATSLYAAVICACVCNALTFWLIRRIGVIRTAYSEFIVPAVTLVLAYFLLGEDITLMKVGGLALVLLGAIFIARRQPKSEEEAPGP